MQQQIFRSDGDTENHKSEVQQQIFRSDGDTANHKSEHTFVEACDAQNPWQQGCIDDQSQQHKASCPQNHLSLYYLEETHTCWVSSQLVHGIKEGGGREAREGREGG